MKFFQKDKPKIPLKKQLQALWRPFVLVFCLVFVIMNWNRLFWVFNYRFIGAKIEETIPGVEKEKTVEELLSAVWQRYKPEPKIEYVEKPDSIEIPKIQITSPLVFVPEGEAENTSPAALKKYLDRGVLHYPGSPLPGEQGQVVILGHSAPVGWLQIKYDWVFSKIDKLDKGDKVVIYYNNHEYVYRVQRTVFLEKGEDLPDSLLTKSRYMLVLISCWPPGKDSRRIAVEAELITNN